MKSTYRGHRDRTVIEGYEQVLRELINAISIPLEPWSVDRICSLFGIKPEQGWQRLTSALDLLGDTENAKTNFNRFGLQGPTRYDDVGEKYLRLYGVLNAVWQQFSALKTLGNVFDVPSRFKREAVLGGLTIVDLRHVAGSHTLDHQRKGAKCNDKRSSYMVSQHSLNTDELTVLDDQNNFKKYPLKELLREWDMAVTDYLGEIAQVVHERLTEPGSKHAAETAHEIALLEKEARGAMVTRMPDGSTVIYEVGGSEVEPLDNLPTTRRKSEG